MDLPGYDAWKLMTPEEEYEAQGGKICPWCGAYDVRHCELEEEMGTCPWEDSEPDPDYARDLKIEQDEFERDHPRSFDDDPF